MKYWDSTAEPVQGRGNLGRCCSRLGSHSRRELLAEFQEESKEEFQEGAKQESVEPRFSAVSDPACTAVSHTVQLD